MQMGVHPHARWSHAALAPLHDGPSGPHPPPVPQPETGPEEHEGEGTVAYIALETHADGHDTVRSANGNGMERRAGSRNYS